MTAQPTPARIAQIAAGDVPRVEDLVALPQEYLHPLIARAVYALAMRAGPVATAELLRDLADDIEKAFRDAQGGGNGR